MRAGDTFTAAPVVYMYQAKKYRPPTKLTVDDAVAQQQQRAERMDSYKLKADPKNPLLDVRTC